VEGEGDFAPGLRARGIATAPRARTPIDLLRRLGILEGKPLLIHCVDLDDEDVATIAASGASVAHCPIANAKLGHGLAPIMRLMRAGVTIGIGTDSVGSNNRLDLLEEARFSALLHRAVERRPDILPAVELLRLCTIEGARALGLDDRIGTLEPGKEADLCAVSLDAPPNVPSFDPVTALFHSARAPDVIRTVVAGRTIQAAGELVTIDVGEARRGIHEAAARLKAVL
jgi:cytosine/adenosine deaminase-related metal-dependent hydrolase